MIHLKVKQMRYKYRYGCDMKNPKKNKNKKQKSNLGMWGPCKHSADRTILVANIFQSILFVISKHHC